MKSVYDSMKEVSRNGVIKQEEALQIAAKADDLIGRMADLLKQTTPSLGLFLGGKIDMILAEARGSKFNAAEYFHNKEPDGQ